MSYNQQLPFSYDQLMAQPMQFRMDAPPCVPNVPCPQNLQYILPAICALVANEASQRYNTHAGRMFLFNQLSVNNYNNNDFATCVATVLDLLSLNLFKQVYRTVEEGLSDAVSKALSIYCSLNFQNYPALQSVTNPDIVNDAFKNIQAFHGLSNEIANFKNRSQQGFPQQSFQQSPQMMMNPSFGGGYNQPPPSYANTYNQPQTNYGGSTSGNSNLFSTNTQQPQGANVQMNRRSVDTGRYDYLKPEQQPLAIIDQKSYFVCLISYGIFCGIQNRVLQ